MEQFTIITYCRKLLNELDFPGYYVIILGSSQLTISFVTQLALHCLGSEGLATSNFGVRDFLISV